MTATPRRAPGSVPNGMCSAAELLCFALGDEIYATRSVRRRRPAAQNRSAPTGVP